MNCCSGNGAAFCYVNYIPLQLYAVILFVKIFKRKTAAVGGSKSLKPVSWGLYDEKQ